MVIEMLFASVLTRPRFPLEVASCRVARMQAPKRHHYVPRMHLKRFVDENGLLHWFSKRFPDRVVRQSSPAQLFSENHLYDVYGSTGVRDSSIELALGRLEGRADGLIENLVRAARAGTPPRLTKQEKFFWDLYFCCQWRRVPDFMRASGVSGLSEAEQRQWVSSILMDYELDGHELTDDDRKILDDRQVLSRLIHGAAARSVLSIGEELEVVAKKGLCIAKIHSWKRSFVIGGNPVVKLTPPGRQHLADPDVEAWLPLAHDVAITPAFSNGEEKLIELRESRFVRHLNEATFKQSTAIAGRSPELVRSLARELFANSA